MDSILLEHIEVATRIGIDDAERSSEQTLLVTVEMLHTLQEIGASDDLTKGIDYARVTANIVQLGTVERKTIERFAEDVAAMILREFKPAGGVRVTVRKTPPLPLQSASVTIQRP